VCQARHKALEWCLLSFLGTYHPDIAALDLRDYTADSFASYWFSAWQQKRRHTKLPDASMVHDSSG